MTTRPIDSPANIVGLIMREHGCTMAEAKEAFVRAAETTTLSTREQIDVKQWRHQRIDELAQAALPALISECVDDMSLVARTEYRAIADRAYDMAEAMQDESERRRRK